MLENTINSFKLFDFCFLFHFLAGRIHALGIPVKISHIIFVIFCGGKKIGELGELLI